MWFFPVVQVDMGSPDSLEEAGPLIVSHASLFDFHKNNTGFMRFFQWLKTQNTILVINRMLNGLNSNPDPAFWSISVCDRALASKVREYLPFTAAGFR